MVIRTVAEVVQTPRECHPGLELLLRQNHLPQVEALHLLQLQDMPAEQQ